MCRAMDATRVKKEGQGHETGHFGVRAPFALCRTQAWDEPAADSRAMTPRATVRLAASATATRGDASRRDTGNHSSKLTAADVEPVVVVRRKLLEVARLDEVRPCRHLDLYNHRKEWRERERERREKNKSDMNQTTCAVVHVQFFTVFFLPRGKRRTLPWRFRSAA
jgi:hypothetical protein